jgi:penicillin-binding protein 1A
MKKIMEITFKVLKWIFFIFQMILLKIFYFFYWILIFILKFIKKFYLIFSLIVTCVVFAVSLYFLYSANVFFDGLNVEKYKINLNNIYDRNGVYIGSTSVRNTVYTKIEDFPTNIKDTVLIVEDKSFFTNIGISIFGILRSAVMIIPSLIIGKRPQGGSTITQQVVRQIALNQRFSFIRKWKEIIFSLVITQKISKSQILELYLNNAYFGSNVYGFNRAASIFFNKDINKLEIHEIALLVALLKSADDFSPVKQPDKAKIRRDYVLYRMKEENQITEEEYNNAINEPLGVSIMSECVSYNSLRVRKFIIDKYGMDAYQKGGFNIKTTLDNNVQKIAENALQSVCFSFELERKWNGPVGFMSQFDYNTLQKYSNNCGKNYFAVMITNVKKGSYKGLFSNGFFNKEDLSLISKCKIGDVVVIHAATGKVMNKPKYTGQVTIMDSSNGEIVASVGGLDVNLSRYNIAETPRPIGSCMKIFDVIALLEYGLKPSTPVNDEPGGVFGKEFKYLSMEEYCKKKQIDNRSSYEKMGMWIVNNWDSNFFGQITLRIAYEFSRNIPFVKLILNDSSLGKLKEVLVRFGLLDSHVDIYPAMILGNHEVKPEIVAATGCSIVSNKLIKPTFIKEENDSTDTNSSTDEKPMLETSVRNNLLSMMYGNVTRGMGRRLKDLNRFLYSKTGTSSNNRDALCLCLTKEYVIFVNVCCYDDDKLADGVMGAKYPVVVIHKILESLSNIGNQSLIDGKSYKSVPYNPFNTPNILTNLNVEEY